jgi:hypothetical protein
LELDLADPRQRQRLPLELQLKLPMRGCVNLAEAERAVECLRDLVQTECNPGQQPADIAVLSWTLPQVQLIEHLWSRSGASPAGAQVRFSTVSAFRDGEAELVVLSLARSQEQLPLAFADLPHDWRLALSCARRRLVILGDPDAVRRRCQVGATSARQTDYLAAHERGVCSRLVQHLEIAPQPLRAAPACEGVAP